MFYKDDLNQQICSKSQIPMNKFCMNPECWMNGRSAECPACFYDYHAYNQILDQHIKDFTDFSVIQKSVREKSQQRRLFLEQFIINCENLFSEKFQKLDFMHSDDLQIQKQKIKQEYVKIIQNLDEEKLYLENLEKCDPNQIINIMTFYNENDKLYQNQLKIKIHEIFNSLKILVQARDGETQKQLVKQIYFYFRLESMNKNLQNQLHTFKRQVTGYFLFAFVLFFSISYQLIYTQKEEIISFCENKYYDLQSQIDADTLKIKNLSEEKEKIHQLISFESNLFKNEMKLLQNKSENNLKINQELLKADILFIEEITGIKEGQLFTKKQQEKIDDEQNEYLLMISENINTLKLQFKKIRIYIDNKELFGIHQQVNLKKFQNYTLLYNNAFGQSLYNSDIESFFKQVTKDENDPLICIGAVNRMFSKEFQLVACDFSTEVFQRTYSKLDARKSKYGNVYWYAKNSFSFGFSPNNKILLQKTKYDEKDPNDELRFSYQLDTFNVRARVGKDQILTQNEYSKFELLIYMIE